MAGFISGLKVTSCRRLDDFREWTQARRQRAPVAQIREGRAGDPRASRVSPKSQQSVRAHKRQSGFELAWHQAEVLPVYTHGGLSSALCAAARVCCQTPKAGPMPADHPEGYIEDFANLYRDAAHLIRARHRSDADPRRHLRHTVEGGLEE